MNENNNTSKNVKLTRKIKVGYGLAGCADAIPCNLLSTYFIFFLTDIAGIRPSIAGIIAFVAIGWDTVTDLIMGKISDGYVTEKGRRLPWMKASILPLTIALCIVFAPFAIQGTAAQMCYYIIAAMLLWFFYTAFTMPYYALGAEITSNYNERNILRFSSTFSDYLSFALATAGPMLIWEWAESSGYSDRQAWFGIGVAFAALMLVSCLAGLYLLRNSEKGFLKNALDAKKVRVKENSFAVWKDCLKIKCFRRIVIWTFLFAIAINILVTAAIYYMTHNIGMDESQQAFFWIIQVASAVCFLVVTTILCNKFGKKPALIAACAPVAIFSYIFFFMETDSVTAVCFYGAVIAIAESAYYAFYLGFSQDSVEIGEFISGERREGSMSGLVSFALKAGMAVAAYGVGAFLDFAGYDGSSDIQTAGALKGILTSVSIIPGIFFTAALIILSAYPVSKKKFELLNAALEKKRVGEQYSTDGFEDII